MPKADTGTYMTSSPVFKRKRVIPAVSKPQHKSESRASMQNAHQLQMSNNARPTAPTFNTLASTRHPSHNMLRHRHEWTAIIYGSRQQLTTYSGHLRDYCECHFRRGYRTRVMAGIRHRVMVERAQRDYRDTTHESFQPELGMCCGRRSCIQHCQLVEIPHSSATKSR